MREGPLYQALIATSRELLLGIAQQYDNISTSALVAEIAGNLGESFINATLRIKFDYNPYDIADTPENRQRINSFNFHSDNDPNWRKNANAWLWLTWLHLEASGVIDRNDTRKVVTPEQYFEAYKSFIKLNENNPAYIETLWAKRKASKDAEFVRQRLINRLNPDKKITTELENKIILAGLGGGFYVP